MIAGILFLFALVIVVSCVEGKYDDAVLLVAFLLCMALLLAVFL